MRPSYHYTSAANWLSDPNGLVHDGELWHMFYQYNPHGEAWGHMAWGHAVSRDLVVWQELAPALTEDAQHLIFSGSAVIDHHNSAGFGAGAMVALYTGAVCGHEANQSQCLAHSPDQGKNWEKFAGNPVIDLGLADFRDPNVFWHEPAARWIMVVALSAENAALIYQSSDLKNWTELSRIYGDTTSGRVWECPLLIELPVQGTDQTHWMFKIDVLHDTAGSGALYCTGSFDGEKFTADESGWRALDHGRDFYAAIAWNGPRDAAGRPCWIGWMGNHKYQAEFPLRGWRGTMSLPRRLALRETPEGLSLVQTIEPGVTAAFSAPRSMMDRSQAIPVASRVQVAAGFRGALCISDGKGSQINLLVSGDNWTITRSDAALTFLGDTITIKRDPLVGLEIWLDSETAEFLSADGEQAASFQHRPEAVRLLLETDDYAAIQWFELEAGSSAAL